jgi:hypothetical protein
MITKVTDVIGLSDAKWVEGSDYEFIPKVDKCENGHSRQKVIGTKFIPGREPYSKVVIYYCQYCKEEYCHLIDAVVRKK